MRTVGPGVRARAVGPHGHADGRPGRAPGPAIFTRL